MTWVQKRAEAKELSDTLYKAYLKATDLEESWTGRGALAEEREHIESCCKAIIKLVKQPIIEHTSWKNWPPDAHA